MPDRPVGAVKIVVAKALLATLWLLPCQAAADGADVLAVVFPVYALAAEVAGDRAEVGLLVPPGMDPHEFALRPHDVRRLEEADVVLLNGAGLEERILGNVLPREKSVGTSRGVDLLTTSGVPDPHVWLDPLSALLQVESIASALAEADPRGASYYRERARLFGDRLRSVHEDLAAGLRDIPVPVLVTYHESFAYFARRYGFRYFSLTGPGAEQPLPGRVRQVYDVVRESRVRAVFAESQFPPDALETLGRDLGVRVCTLDTLGTGDTRETGRPVFGLYERAMRENLRTLLTCLVP
jgi:zinc transport system substrate-binding protein